MKRRRFPLDATRAQHRGPEPARRSESSNGEELVGVGGDSKADRGRRSFDREAGPFERSKHGDAGGEHPAQLLDLVGSGVGVAGGVDRAGDDVGMGLGDRRRQLGDGGQVAD